MKVTVCELSNDPADLDADWQALIDHVNAESSDLVLLPEMPFHPWLAKTDRFDPAAWQASVQAHDLWIRRLQELGPATVIGSRPVIKAERRLNEGFIWESVSGYRPAHTKYYLPNDRGFWEASWYERGVPEFKAIETGKAKIGFLICTELWFNIHARQYAKQGVELLVCPRATPMASIGKWVAGGRTAAVVSGAYCLSSNLGGGDKQELEFGGAGWIIEPEAGDVLGLTSRESPFLTMEIDLTLAQEAKETYPRYVLD